MRTRARIALCSTVVALRLVAGCVPDVTVRPPASQGGSSGGDESSNVDGAGVAGSTSDDSSQPGHGSGGANGGAPELGGRDGGSGGAAPASGGADDAGDVGTGGSAGAGGSAGSTDSELGGAAGATNGACALLQPLNNGSFEMSASDPGLGEYLFAPSSAITNWTVSSGSVTYYSQRWSSDGARSVELNGGSAGALQYQLSTQPGHHYELWFALAGNPDRTTVCCGGAANSPVVKTMRLTAGNLSKDYSFDVTGMAEAGVQWEHHTLSFVASSSTTTLTFASTTNSPYWGPLLDDVRIAKCD